MLTLDPSTELPSSAELAFLQLRLDAQMLILLPMDSVQEVLTIPAKRLTMVPNMPNCVMGLLNQRSHLYWAVDLAKFLGFPGIDGRGHHFQLALLNSQAASFGLIVEGIEGVVRAPLEALSSPLKSSHRPFFDYLQGELIVEQVSLPVLNPRSIATDQRFGAQ